MVTGDLNIDLLLDELVLRKKFGNMMAAHCLSLSSLREATRNTETSRSCINAIFGNVPLLKYTIEKSTFSDHCSLHSKLDLEYEDLESIYVFNVRKNSRTENIAKKLNFNLAHAFEKLFKLETQTSRRLLESKKENRINVFLAKISKISLTGNRG